MGAAFRLVPFVVAVLLLAMQCEETPGPVRNLTATTIHDRLSIWLQWEHATGPAETYVVLRKDARLGWIEIARMPAADATQYTDSDGLEDGQRYYYRVVTQLADGAQSNASPTVDAIATDLPRPSPTPTPSL